VSIAIGSALDIGAGVRAQTCPAIGKDTACGITITISDTGAITAATGQGPYDGIDDTLVGVINNSKLPIFALGLNSTKNIFGFDGDGLTSFGGAGNSRDTLSNGYGGPNARFSNVGAGAKSGVVNFNTPLARISHT
jgi:hypothetical protein